MAMSPRVRRWVPALLTLAVLASPVAANAQAKKRKAKVAGDRPVAVISVASANRMLQDVEQTFKSAGKPQIYDLIKGFLGGINDLKGLDRDKPLGFMVFVTAGIPPSVTPIGFVPVKDMNELLKTLSNGPFTAKKVPEKKNRYEITTPRDPIYVAVKNGYAFFSNKEESLELNFPDPTVTAKSLAKRYDIAASVNLNAIAAESRTLFATILRTSAEGELQRRDDEPEMAYNARKARGMRDLAWIEAMLLDCETVLIGLDASSKQKKIVLEAAVEARPKSKLAKMVKKIGAKRSYFDNLLKSDVPLSVSFSWGLNKHEKKMFAESFNFVGGRMAYILDPDTIKKSNEEKKKEATEKKAAPKKKFQDLSREERRARIEARQKQFRERMRQVRKFSKDSPVAKVIEPLIATAEKGHADFFLQFVGEPPSKFTLLAGANVENGRQFAAGMIDVFKEVQKRSDAPTIKLNAESYKGIAFHRIDFGRVPRQMRQFFGERPSLYVGASSSAVWVALGSDGAIGELTKAIDKVIGNTNVGKKRGSTAPFRVAVNVAQWLAMAGEGDGRGPGAVARKAFAKGGDGVRVEVRTTDNGLRFRVQFDEGFLKLIGMLIADGYERSRGI